MKQTILAGSKDQSDAVVCFIEAVRLHFQIIFTHQASVQVAVLIRLSTFCEESAHFAFIKITPPVSFQLCS